MKIQFQLFALIAVLVIFPVISASAKEQTEENSGWGSPDYTEIRDRISSWSKQTKLQEPLLKQIMEMWPETYPEDEPHSHLDLLSRTAMILDNNAKSLVSLISSVDYQSKVAEQSWLKDSDSKLPPIVRDNLRLSYGRWLAEQHLFDEALEQLQDLSQDQVADPASLLFYKAVCQHHLLKKEDCVKNLNTLVSAGEEVPVRYLTLAKLMLSDIEPLQTDSLDEVARLMRDIERRLGLGRAGKTVRKEEEDVVAKLDKMIDELEKQQQQQQQQAGGQSGGNGQNQPSNPLNDSVPAGGSGPGNIDPRELENRSAWGNLPPKERQEALQQISNEFPSHYRRVIEEYFRKLAKEESSQ